MQDFSAIPAEKDLVEKQTFSSYIEKSKPSLFKCQSESLEYLEDKNK
jgi:hypothetical protein